MKKIYPDIPCRRKWFNRKANRGFTLIETLVAMMLLAIILVIILQLFSGGLKSNKMAEDYTRAIFHARAKMEELLLKNDLGEGSFEGDFEDNYRWKAEITLVEPDQTEEDWIELKKPVVDTFKIDLSIVWDSGIKEKSFQISTQIITEASDEGV